MFIITILLLHLLVYGGSDCARILVVTTLPVSSHHRIYKPICTALASSHHLVHITTHPIQHPNITTINVGYLERSWNDRHNLSRMMSDNSQHFLTKIRNIYDAFLALADEALSDQNVAGLIANRSETFDLVMIEYLQTPLFAFKHRFDCPFIGVTSKDAYNFGHEAMGNPTHPGLYTELLPADNLQQRVLNLVLYVIFQLFEGSYANPQASALIAKHFGDGYPSVDELSDSIDLLFINTNPILHDVRPVSPATIVVGGGLHIGHGDELPSKDLCEFLDAAERGVLLVSLGTTIKSSYVPQIKSILLELFGMLDMSIVWKYEDYSFTVNMSHVMTMKWIPQQQILNHRNIKVFITQGGAQSLEEAIYYKVPVIVWPFISDQFGNGRKIEGKGIGLSTDGSHVTAATLKRMIDSIVNDQAKYRNNLEKWSRILTDQPLTGIEKAVWWTEYLLRHKTGRHLKGATMPWHRRFYIDALLVCIILPTIILLNICKRIRAAQRKRRSKSMNKID